MPDDEDEGEEAGGAEGEAVEAAEGEDDEAPPESRPVEGRDAEDPPERQPEGDRLAWLPYAVLALLVLLGVAGFVGVLSR